MREIEIRRLGLPAAYFLGDAMGKAKKRVATRKKTLNAKNNDTVEEKSVAKKSKKLAKKGGNYELVIQGSANEIWLAPLPTRNADLRANPRAYGQGGPPARCATAGDVFPSQGQPWPWLASGSKYLGGLSGAE
jgi:hypothetical protein